MTYALIFLAGLAFSGHCVGMCGAFPLALGTGARGAARAAALQLLYHAGKTSTYVFAGVLAAAAGLRFEPLRRPLGLAAGVLLIAVGVASLAPRAVSPRLARWLRGSPLCWILSGLLRDARPLPAFSVGVFNGFLPCGLVYGMLAYAATLGSIPRAALSMACFGAGTVPALAVVGMSAHLVRRRWQAGSGPARLARASGLLMVLLGVIALLRAATPQRSHLHHLIAGMLA